VEVIIDGVRYIPAKSAIANTLDIVKGLLAEGYGTADDEEAENQLRSGYYRVLVNDWGEGVPLSKIIDNISEIAKG